MHTDKQHRYVGSIRPALVRGTWSDDTQVAAVLAAAVISRGHTAPEATNATMAAEQAVAIYRSVLAALDTADTPQ